MQSVWSGKRVTVTGGAGFLGTLLARRLLAGPVPVGGAGRSSRPIRKMFSALA